MPIFVALFVLIALIYGAVRAYHVLAAHFGAGVAIGAAAVAALIVIAALAYGWRRHRAEHRRRRLDP
jgi:hypothetical protein